MWWTDDGWPWLSSWLTSPGFGGFAAVIAAFVALGASRRQSRLAAWWQRAEWALERYTSPDSTPQQREVGAAALGVLEASRIGGRAEEEFLIAIVVAMTLDPQGDGLGETGDPPTETEDAATYLEMVEGGSDEPE